MSEGSTAARVAVLGGVPQLLGGGGLEDQAESTREALRVRGHDARAVPRTDRGWQFDVLHVFGHGADVGQYLHHWRLNPARLVISPVVVVPVHRERRLAIATKLPIPAFEPRVLGEMVRRADHLVALTDWEAGFLRKVGGARTAPVSVIGNGVDLPDDLVPVTSFDGEDLPEKFVVTVGAVSPRKRQLEIARRLRGVAPYVVVGGWEGPDDERAAFGDAVRATGGQWLGEIRDRRTVLGVVAAAGALVHMSDAEGQSLAVLEALAVGTPCVLSDLPQQRESEVHWPTHVVTVEGLAELAGAVRNVLAGDPGAAPSIPAWDDVAASLERVYACAMEQPPRLWNARG